MVLARIILGFLTIGPMTGYDLTRAFSSSAAYFWSADKAQIYRTLARLVVDGHARTEVVRGVDAPDRVVHHITDAGRAALVDWLSSNPNGQNERDAFVARVFFSEALDSETLVRVIDVRREAAAAALADLRSVQAELPAADPVSERAAWLRAMTLENGIRGYEMHIEWLDRLSTGLAAERT